ncbi:hypothetical protein CBL_10530 [Carabus blaptoides fortunei]
MGKRKCIFTDKLKEDYTYLKSQSEKGSRVRCSICNGDFSVEHKGRGDIEDHNRSEKHKRALNAAHSSSITSFFKSRKQPLSFFNMDSLFDELSLVNKIVRHEKFKDDTSLSDKWMRIFKIARQTNICVNNIYKLVEFSLCLPGTSAPVERVFSMMGNIWSAERAEDCPRRWGVLRTKYAKCKIEKKIIPSGAAASGKREWPLFQHLQFLDGFLECGPSQAAEPIELEYIDEDFLTQLNAAEKAAEEAVQDFPQ